MELRDYQEAMLAGVFSGWQQGHRNVLVVAPTGSGKTVVKAALHTAVDSPSLALAHKQELVAQMSLALAEQGVEHRVLAPNPVVKFCVARQVVKLGRSFINAASSTLCASVQTLNARAERYGNLLSQCQMWDIDEGHHVLRDNQWGRAVDGLSHAWGAAFTATPYRTDKKALGRDAKGLFDTMVLGPTPRDLIARGYLTPYRIYAPAPSIDTTTVRTGASGDYVQKELRQAAHKSRVVGDIVDSYLRFAPGKIGLTFCVDVEIAKEQAEAFNHKGIPAATVSAKTPDSIRAEVLDRLACGDLKQVTNVDLFGEGMDCPALEVISMGRPTHSRALYRQQFGRVMRVMEGKEFGICIDHAGNVHEHGLPDNDMVYSLSDDRAGRKDRVDNEYPIKTCMECMLAYEAFHVACPYCGHKPVPEGRSLPDFVEGDLFELDQATLDRMRIEINRIDGSPQIPVGASDAVTNGATHNWNKRRSAQRDLRETIDMWAGVMKYGHDATDKEIFRRFYHLFQVDVASAMALNTTQARTLTDNIRKHLL